jgi:hypothetical protein
MELVLEGPTTVTLPAPSAEGAWRVWVVDIMGLELPPGQYRVIATDGAGGTHEMAPGPTERRPPDEPTLDAKVADFAQGSVSVFAHGRTVAINVIGADQRPRIISLNYSGPEVYELTASFTPGRYDVIATDRDSGANVECGEINDGVGTLRVTAVVCPTAPGDSRWDIALRGEDGVATDLFGPAVDYARPDQTTTYGDITFVKSGTHDRWKPYITRDGRLAVRVTSEREGSEA